MLGRLSTMLVLAGIGAGCVGQTRRAPAIQASTAQPRQDAPQPDLLRQAGDATWGVITTPVRIVGGGAGNKASPQEPAPTLPPAVLISPRDGDDGDAGGGQ